MTENIIEGLERIPSESSIESYRCDSHNFSKIIFTLESDFSYLWLVGLFQRSLGADRALVKYIFFDFDRYRKFSLFYEIGRGERIYSVRHLWKNAGPYEDKLIADCELEIFHPHQFRVEPKDEVVYMPQYKMGLSGSLYKNNNRINLFVDNETILRSNLERGLFEIGLESILEQTSFDNCYEIIENYFPLKGATYSQVLSHSLEKSFGVEITDRAKGLRMVILEFKRILDHAYYFEKISHHFQNDFLKMKASLWVQRVQSLLVSYSGNEFGKHLIRFGGVCLDVNQSWSSRVIDEMRWLQGDIQRFQDSFFGLKVNEELFQHKLVSKEDIFQWSMTGPLARSVGVNLDLRKMENFYFYSDIDFEVPIGVDGTIFDYVLVLMEEMVQSGHIITQVLDNLPTGSVFPSDSTFNFFHSFQGQDESESDYMSSVKEYLKERKVKFASLIEGPRGIVGLDIDNMTENKSFKMIGTQFILADFFEKKLEGKNIDQVTPMWGGLDVDLKEIEK